MGDVRRGVRGEGGRRALWWWSFRFDGLDERMCEVSQVVEVTDRRCWGVSGDGRCSFDVGSPAQMCSDLDCDCQNQLQGEMPANSDWTL